MIDRDELAKEIFVGIIIHRLPDSVEMTVQDYRPYQQNIVKKAYEWADVFLAVQKEACSESEGILIDEDLL